MDSFDNTRYSSHTRADNRYNTWGRGCNCRRPTAKHFGATRTERVQPLQLSGGGTGLHRTDMVWETA